jgi:uncharacterized protein
MRKFFVSTLICFTIMLALASCGPESAEEYSKKITEERQEKNEFMKSSSESPFKNANEEFKELNYYPPDLRYKIKASVDLIENPNTVNLATSDNKENEYLEYGSAHFKLRGENITLRILEITDPGPTHGTLFLAFADSTSARSTYGAGRYLELKKIAGMTSVVLDFNKAYNPYCAYNDSFSIAAGEKSYH